MLLLVREGGTRLIELCEASRQRARGARQPRPSLEGVVTVALRGLVA